MIWFWPTVIKPVLDAVAPRLVVEIGAARGHTTRKLLERARSAGCVVHVIDPAPAFDVDAFQEEFGKSFVLHRAWSHDALPLIPPADVVLIDGDHNWYTVHRELQLIETIARSTARRFPIVLLHDVSWPYARRDMYYDPEGIPEEHRQPHRRAGVVLGQAALSTEKGINGGTFNAESEGTPRNGVLTAVEDFMAESEFDFAFRSLPGFAGIGVLVDADVLSHDDRVRTQFDRLHEPEFLIDHSMRLEQLALRTQMLAADTRRELKKTKRRLKQLQRARGVPQPPAAPAADASVPAVPAAESAATAQVERPVSAMRAVVRARGLRVAAVVGATLQKDLRDVCDLVALDPGRWREQLAEAPPAIMLVESAVRESGGARDDGSSWGAPEALLDVLAWCTRSGIPTAFWATLDNASLTPFYDAARRCDHVFVADPEAAAPLAAAIGARQLPGVLPLAAPRRPPEAERRNGPVYVGRWSDSWDDTARRTLTMLLDAAMEHGLQIFLCGDEDVELPSRYRNCSVRIADDRDARLAALAGSSVAICFHPAMPTARHLIARSVFEALASGAAPMISPGNARIRHVFADAVVQVRTPDEVAENLALLLGDAANREARLYSVRDLIERGQTYEHRLATIASAAGLRIVPDPRRSGSGVFGSATAAEVEDGP